MRIFKYAIILIFLSGCAFRDKFMDKEVKMKSYRVPADGVTLSMIYPKDILKKYQRIAITDFKSNEKESLAGIEIADRISIRLLNKGYKIVERDHLKSLLKEKYLNYVGVIDPVNLKEFKMISGADALITGTVGTYQSGIGSISSHWGNVGGTSTTPQSEVSVSIKMLDIETGDILFTAAGAMAGKRARGYILDEILRSAFLHYPKAK